VLAVGGLICFAAKSKVQIIGAGRRSIIERQTPRFDRRKRVTFADVAGGQRSQGVELKEIVEFFTIPKVF